MTGLLARWFGWYSGAVWSNLAASFIWSGVVWFPTMLHLHRKVDRQHAELVEQDKKRHAALKRHLGIEETGERSE